VVSLKRRDHSWTVGGFALEIWMYVAIASPTWLAARLTL